MPNNHTNQQADNFLRIRSRFNNFRTNREYCSLRTNTIAALSSLEEGTQNIALSTKTWLWLFPRSYRSIKRRAFPKHSLLLGKRCAGSEDSREVNVF